MFKRLLLSVIVLLASCSFVFATSESTILQQVAKKYCLNADQTMLLLAIRKQENGKAGKEMGVLLPKAQRFANDPNKSLELQACYAAGTIKKYYRSSKDLEAFAARWCPLGASNDPNNLNKNWLPNVKRFLSKQSERPVDAR